MPKCDLLWIISLQVIIRDRQLFGMVAVLLLIDIIILVTWQIVDPLTNKVENLTLQVKSKNFKQFVRFWIKGKRKLSLTSLGGSLPTHTYATKTCNDLQVLGNLKIFSNFDSYVRLGCLFHRNINGHRTIFCRETSGKLRHVTKMAKIFFIPKT